MMPNFEKFVESTFKDFLAKNGLASGTISDGCGNSATVTKDKHGFYKVKYVKTKENV